MSFPLPLSAFTRKHLYRRLQQAYTSGALKRVKRIHALLALAQGQSVSAVAALLSLGEHTVRDSRHQSLCQGIARLVSQASPGRPSTRTTTQRHPLAAWSKASPPAMGYPSGCWNTPMVQDRIQRHCGVAYHPHSIATLLKNMGFSYPKARLISDHRNEAKRLEWRHPRWPKILRQAKQHQALLLFGDEASGAQWGSVSYTWAPKGQHPEVPTSGTRQAYKVCGLMDYVSGHFFYQAHAGRCHSESSTAFWLDVLSQTTHLWS